VRDKARFANWITQLADLFGRQLSTFAVEAYWEALDDVNDADGEASAKRARRTCRFMPAPAELRDLVRTVRAGSFCPKCHTNPCECRLLASLPDKPDPRISEAVRADMEALHAHLTPKEDA
jgi:hypothetical protein